MLDGAGRVTRGARSERFRRWRGAVGTTGRGRFGMGRGRFERSRRHTYDYRWHAVATRHLRPGQPAAAGRQE